MHNFIKQAALSIGFDACGIARAEALPHDAAFMRKWLAEGKHGEMHYLTRNFRKRTDPRALVPDCRSVVALLLNYFPPQQQPPYAPKIAKYAYSAVDYHTVIKDKLRRLEEIITAEYGADCINSVYQHSFVDSAPVLERRWAQRAGLGWIGKNTQLINPDFGSYCFIGILMLNCEVEEYDQPLPNRCGTCICCIKSCPTSALANGSMDARKCLSYLTIELKDEVPEEVGAYHSATILGCDICADVCPWNKKKARPHCHSALTPVPQILNWEKQDWENLNEEDFNTLFRNSAVKRAGFQRLKGNIEKGQE